VVELLILKGHVTNGLLVLDPTLEQLIRHSTVGDGERGRGGERGEREKLSNSELFSCNIQKM
jgi:hypothetical protein